MKLREVDVKEYARFLKEVEKRSESGGVVDYGVSFLQSVEMYQRYVDEGREAYLLGLYDKKKMVAGGVVVKIGEKMGRKIFRMAGGPVLNYQNCQEILTEFSSGVREFLKGKGGSVLLISPQVSEVERDRENQVVGEGEAKNVKVNLQKLGWKYLGESGQAKWIYVMDNRWVEAKKIEDRGVKKQNKKAVLPEGVKAGTTEAEIYENLRTNHRQEIRRAEREGLKVVELSEQVLPVLKKITTEAGERHEFQDPDIKYFKSMKEAFGEKVKFYAVVAPIEVVKKYSEEVSGLEINKKYVAVAGAMFMEDKPREIVYLYSGSLARFQRLGGAYLLQWEMIKKMVVGKYYRYNFYGVRPAAGNGVYKFKQGFRDGKVVEIVGTFGLALDLFGKLYLMRMRANEYGNVQ